MFTSHLATVRSLRQRRPWIHNRGFLGNDRRPCYHANQSRCLRGAHRPRKGPSQTRGLHRDRLSESGETSYRHFANLLGIAIREAGPDVPEVHGEIDLRPQLTSGLVRAGAEGVGSQPPSPTDIPTGCVDTPSQYRALRGLSVHELLPGRCALGGGLVCLGQLGRPQPGQVVQAVAACGGLIQQVDLGQGVEHKLCGGLGCS